MALSDTLEKHNGQIESLIDVFEAELVKMLMNAQGATVQRMMSSLKFTRGTLQATPENRATLRKLSQVFVDEMNGEGYADLVDTFVSRFDGQLTFFKDVLQQTLGSKVDATRLFSLVRLTNADQKFLHMAQQDAASWLDGVVAGAADQMRNKALLSVGGLTPRVLTNLISKELGVVPGVAKTVAATTISSFYRTVADVSFKKIEADPDFTITYKYVGPPAGDPVIRPFCKNLMRRTKAGTTWTRQQIEEMNNNQLPDVMISCGGYNCRHQWVVAEVVRKLKTMGAGG